MSATTVEEGPGSDRQSSATLRELEGLRRHFRRAVRLLSVATRFPITAVTFADGDGGQALVAEHGVENAHRAALLRSAELTASAGGVRTWPDLAKTPVAAPFFFAGVALQVNGRCGVLCVMGPPRSAWDTASQNTLIEIQAWLEDTLEALRIGRVDHLTGLPNRRDIEEVLQREWRRALRDPAPVSVLAIDIDHFKKYNDTYGHPAGDEALTAVAEALQRAMKRPGDAVGRMGGEEFLACLPHTDAAGAALIAEAARVAVESLKIPHRGGMGIVTVSIGSASVTHPPGSEGGIRAVVAAADRALYVAKACGRNQVVSMELPSPPSPEPDVPPRHRDPGMRQGVDR